jgi:putative transposase
MNLKAGMQVIYQGCTMEVLDASSADKVILIDRNANAIHQCTSAEVALPINRAAPLVMEDASQWKEWDRIAQAARKIIAAQTTPERKKLYEESARELNCSVRTLQRKVKQFRIHDTVSALAPGKSGRRTGTRMLSPKVEEIIATNLDKLWLQENQPDLAPVIEHIQRECRKLELPQPSPTSIRQRARALSDGLRIRRRKGAKAAKYKLDPMVGQIKAAMLLETVQIDHTLADVILISELDPSIYVGRPWVTLAIDVASRMIVGVYISLESPSAVSVGMCLANALLSKSDFLKALGLRGEWPVQGIMVMIHTDNGREFHSEPLQRGCSELGIDMQQRPVGSPHYGAIIERAIGTFMGKCRLLPGSTHRNVSERGDYDAEGKAVMTLQQFTAFFVNEILIYHATKHRTLGVSMTYGSEIRCAKVFHINTTLDNSRDCFAEQALIDQWAAREFARKVLRLPTWRVSRPRER